MQKSRSEDREVAELSVQLIERRRAIEALKVQCDERDRIVEKLRARCTAQDLSLHTLTEELRDLKGSKAWKVAQSLHRARAVLAPRGTMRWRTLQLAWLGARVLLRDGPLIAGGKGVRKIAARAIRMPPFRPALATPVPAPTSWCGGVVEVPITGEPAEAVYQSHARDDTLPGPGREQSLERTNTSRRGTRPC